jgi:hypothetical protein
MKAIVLSGLLLFATAAVAGAMMPAGTGPESGQAGVWRVIDAKPAPWAPQRKLTKADAPLLEYAVEFGIGVVKGPAPLACNTARYSSGVTYRNELFGGRIKSDQMAAALKLSQQPSTNRVICGASVRDYYVDDGGDMKMAEGDVIYTLERPTGSNPEQYKAGYSGPSFDCITAKTTGERLICSDAGLSKSDIALSQKYLAIKKSESPESFATFQAGERSWLAYLMKSCGGNAAWPDQNDDRNTISGCIGSTLDARAALFDNVKGVRSGALTIEPRMRFRTRDNPNTEESDIYPVMSGGAQAAAFNAYIAKALKLGQWRMDDKTLFRYGSDIVPDGALLHAHRSYGVIRFDSRIVSLGFATTDFVGGHDEEPGGFTLNWDMAKAKPVTIADMLTGNWAPFVLTYCTKSVTDQTTSEQEPADIGLSDMKKQLSDNANWSWQKNKAVVTFAIIIDSGLPQQSYSVDLPYKMLKPYLKPDAPVLAQ